MLALMSTARALTRTLGLATLAFMLTAACSTAGDGETCNGQGQCVCADSCSRTCDSGTGGSCELVCESGTCSFDCPGGDCRVSCSGTASCNVACPKGGCTVYGGSGTTDVKCGGLGTCTVACTGPSDRCLVDGEPAVGGTGGLPGALPAEED